MCRKFSSSATALFNRLPFFICCFILSVNFRWHLFCLLFVSVCTFEMFCYLAAVWKSLYLMVNFSYSHTHRHLSSLVFMLRWDWSSLDCHQAVRFTSGVMAKYLRLVSWVDKRTYTAYTHTHTYTHVHAMNTWTHSETFVANTTNELPLSLSLAHSIRLFVISNNDVHIHTRPIALQTMIRV